MMINGQGRKKWMGDTTEQPIEVDRPHLGIVNDWRYRNTKNGQRYIVGNFINMINWRGTPKSSALIVDQMYNDDGSVEIVTLVSRFTLNPNRPFIPPKPSYYSKSINGGSTVKAASRVILAFDKEGNIMSEYPVPFDKVARRAQVRRAKKFMAKNGAVSFKKVNEQKWLKIMFPSIT